MWAYYLRRADGFSGLLSESGLLGIHQTRTDSSSSAEVHMKCRTIDYAGKGKVDFIEVEVNEPGPGEVQIESLASGICAWDVHVFKNGVDWPTCPGHEGVGRAVKLGAGVANLEEGDWATG